jgi:hypothetical protein
MIRRLHGYSFASHSQAINRAPTDIGDVCGFLATLPPVTGRR